MMASPRVLTFNFHEPYLCLMAKTGFPLTVGLYTREPFARKWREEFRPIPPNVTFMAESTWRRDLEAGMFDVVVAHNELNAASLFSYDAPKILVCHNRRSFLKTTVQGDREKGIRNYDELLVQLQEKFAFVFISESKRADYALPGRVILPGIDVEEYGGYTGEVAEVLRVGNSMRARDLMFDVDFQEQVCEGIPNRVVGEDPSIPGAVPSSSFEGLLDKYRSLRCLLHVTREDWEDGYNLAMLEAMACGMPVVSLGNRTSPLTDGVDGFVSYDAEVLRERLWELLGDVAMAKEIGARGRETVAKRFPMERFVDSWRAAIEETAEGSSQTVKGGAGASKPKGKNALEELELSDKGEGLPRLRVILACPAPRGSIGEHLERAFGEHHEVVRVEPSTPAASIPMADPHLYLWVDDGELSVPEDLTLLECTTACYLVRTHECLGDRVALAQQFDFVFVAHHGHVEALAQAGNSKVAWLPLGCSGRAHTGRALESVHDVACILPLDESSPLDEHRTGLMQSIADRFPNSKVGRFPPEELAEIYSKCRVVVNESAGQGLPMHLFEAMASGALVVTDKAEGLDDLFKAGEHLAVFEGKHQALELTEAYLKSPAQRERVASAGAELVRKEHTLESRVEYMLGLILETLGLLGGFQGESRFRFGGYYCAPRPELVPHIPRHVRRMLDVGCGAGEFGQLMKRRGVKEVVGMEVVERACEIAKRNLDDAILGNIEEMELPFEDGYFDCVCFADVLEHLVKPTEVLRKVSRVLAPDGVIVMSIPNARFFQVVEMLAHGRWRYEDAGILDRTHLRFFTALEMQVMVREAGLDVLRIAPLSMMQEEQVPRNPDGSITLGRMTFRLLDDAEYQDFLTYQYVVVAGRRDADRLAAARRALDEGDGDAAYEIAKQAEGADEFERTCLMARAVVRLGKLDTAESLYRKALELRPGDAATTSELGILLVAVNRHREGKALLEAADTEVSGHERAVGALGLAHLQDGNLEKAFELLKQSLEMQFNNEALMVHFAATARQLGRLSEVEVLLRKFVDFYPGNVAMTYEYARLLCDQGQFAQARDRLETLLLLSPNHEGARQLLRQIPEETE